MSPSPNAKVPTPFIAQGAAAALILITERASKRRNRTTPGTLTRREHLQCETLRNVIKCYQSRQAIEPDSLALARRAAECVAIQF